MIKKRKKKAYQQFLQFQMSIVSTTDQVLGNQKQMGETDRAEKVNQSVGGGRCGVFSAVCGCLWAAMVTGGQSAADTLMLPRQGSLYGYAVVAGGKEEPKHLSFIFP